MRDFDKAVQEKLDKLGKKEFRKPDWRKWLEFTAEEFEDYAERNTGKSFEEIENSITEPRSFSISPENFRNSIILHTSGTSGKPKYYLLSEEMLTNNWMPGMYAIFNSAGLERRGKVVIFVQERKNREDGIDENGNVVLLSSEFSQRLVVSMFDADYLISTYPNSRRLDVLSEILGMDKVEVVSAPASTISRWADINLLSRGIKEDLKFLDEREISEDFRRILRKPFERAVKEIHRLLWEKLRSATFIFSFSSLTENRWRLINSFVKKKCNLYVLSEAGPVACSFCISDDMFVMPLSIPVIREDMLPITRTRRDYGELLVTNSERNNVLTGDAVMIEDRNPPKIYREVLRMPIEIGETNGRKIFAGGYWREGCEILNTYAIRNTVIDFYSGRIFFDVVNKIVFVENSPKEVETALKLKKGKFKLGCDFRVELGNFEISPRREWWVYFVC